MYVKLLIILGNQRWEIAAGECNDKTPGNNGLTIEFYEFSSGKKSVHF